ncbi:polyphosphate polymerase domain-containing protein [Candidatus Saccharibacteria bacterium]|nr:polyphosphate polymerase domain-containing protein [Candidatus Saccharibacteria bacterium]
MDEKRFDRVEKKYLISEAQKAEILKSVLENMKKDGYHRSGVYNLYFDTKNYDMIIRSIERPKFKEKLRARSYKGYDKVFLEIKTKIKGPEYNVGYKRRVLITREDFEKLVSGEATVVELAREKIETPADLQVAKEVDYLISKFALKPKIMVYYDRESYVGENGLRITFDENLAYRDKKLSFEEKEQNEKYFNGEEKKIIMEIKAHGVMPLWLVKSLSAAKAYPQQFSKIGKVYEKLNRKEK